MYGRQISISHENRVFYDTGKSVWHVSGKILAVLFWDFLWPHSLDDFSQHFLGGFISAQQFSITLRSEEFGGQFGKTVTLFSANHFLTYFAVWQGAESCWKLWC